MYANRPDMVELPDDITNILEYSLKPASENTAARLTVVFELRGDREYAPVDALQFLLTNGVNHLRFEPTVAIPAEVPVAQNEELIPVKTLVEAPEAASIVPEAPVSAETPAEAPEVASIVSEAPVSAETPIQQPIQNEVPPA